MTEVSSYLKNRSLRIEYLNLILKKIQIKKPLRVEM